VTLEFVKDRLRDANLDPVRICANPVVAGARFRSHVLIVRQHRPRGSICAYEYQKLEELALARA
jgi:hypothetical protein